MKIFNPLLINFIVGSIRAYKRSIADARSVEELYAAFIVPFYLFKDYVRGWGAFFPVIEYIFIFFERGKYLIRKFYVDLKIGYRPPMNIHYQFDIGDHYAMFTVLGRENIVMFFHDLPGAADKILGFLNVFLFTQRLFGMNVITKLWYWDHDRNLWFSKTFNHNVLYNEDDLSKWRHNQFHDDIDMLLYSPYFEEIYVYRIDIRVEFIYSPAAEGSIQVLIPELEFENDEFNDPEFTEEMLDFYLKNIDGFKKCHELGTHRKLIQDLKETYSIKRKKNSVTFFSEELSELIEEVILEPAPESSVDYYDRIMKNERFSDTWDSRELDRLGIFR